MPPGTTPFAFGSGTCHPTRLHPLPWSPTALQSPMVDGRIARLPLQQAEGWHALKGRGWTRVTTPFRGVPPVAEFETAEERCECESALAEIMGVFR